jgi:hypothetical protein
MPRPSHPPCFDHPNNTGRRVQTMQLLITQFSPNTNNSILLIHFKLQAKKKKTTRKAVTNNDDGDADDYDNDDNDGSILLEMLNFLPFCKSNRTFLFKLVTNSNES